MTAKGRISSAIKGARRGRGRPPFRPAQKERDQVETLAAAGYDEDMIGRFIGVSAVTLRKHFRAELDNATPKLIGLAVASLAKALGKGEAWATCFVLKTRGRKLGWTERHEITGPDGAALFDLTRLSNRELDAFEELARKAGAVIHKPGDDARTIN